MGLHTRAFSGPGREIDPRIAALPTEEEKQLPVRSNLQGNEVADIFYFIEPRPRNLFAASGSLAFLSLLLLALIIIPLFHTDPLPKMQTVTMLYLPPAPAAAGNVTKLRAPVSLSTYVPTSMAVPTPLHETQEATSTPPPVPVASTGGVVGGVPGGVVGGAPIGGA